MDVLPALGLGLLAGFAVAIPLGAIGVLLVQEGATLGARRGLAAATAVGTVDMLYCIAAVSAGSLLAPVITGWGDWPGIIGGGVLIALGLHGLRKLSRSRGSEPAETALPGRRRYVLFFALTAINPVTLLYFAALVTSLGDTIASPGAAVAFVAAVGIASLSWQVLLVVLGAGMRRKSGAGLKRWTPVVGNGIVAVLGAALIAQALA